MPIWRYMGQVDFKINYTTLHLLWHNKSNALLTLKNYFSTLWVFQKNIKYLVPECFQQSPYTT